MVHRATLFTLSFSPDGKWLATGHDRSLQIWDAQTGEPHGESIPHPDMVNIVCFSPDGQRLLTCDGKNDLAQIRDFRTCRLLVELRGHEGYIISAEFSPDGRRVATGSEDGTARIWNAQTGQMLAGPLQHKSMVFSAKFSSNGHWLVTASADATAQVWDAQTGQRLGKPLRHRNQVTGAEFSPDGLLVLTVSDDGTVGLWDAHSGLAVAEHIEHESKVWEAHFSPDGRRVLTVPNSHDVRVWDVPPSALRENELATGTIPTEELVRANEAAALILADLAEAVIGKRLTREGMLESVLPVRLAEIRQQLVTLPANADFTCWLEWFFADRGTRMISPRSNVNISEYVEFRAKQADPISWREALMLCPTNASALARLSPRNSK